MEYEQGSTPRFYATFADYKGEAAVISGMPTITITHIWGENPTYDILDMSMSLLSGTTYSYTWSIPARADKTTYTVLYNAIYSGVSASTRVDALGAFDFQVIPRKFYDKKGGGLVQRIITKGIWTVKEKDELIEAIEDLLKRNNSLELLSIKQEIEKLPKEKFDIKLIELIFNNLSNHVKKEFELQKTEIRKYERLIQKLNEKEINFDDRKIINKIGILSKSISEIDIDLKNERITRVISEIEDLHKELKEFEEVFVKTIPLKVAEMIKNGD